MIRLVGCLVQVECRKVEGGSLVGVLGGSVC